MRTANALERVLNKYMTSVPPYDGPVERSFPVFAEEIERIRNDADEALLHTWQAAETRGTFAGQAKGRITVG